MKIAILESQPHIAVQYLTYLTQAGHQLISYGQEHDPQKIDAIIIRSNIKVNKDLLKIYNKLKYVLRVGVGIENIDQTILQEQKIKLINTAGSNAQSVAELTIRGMLSLLRNTQTERHTLDDRFTMMGNELSGKTIGIVGIGNIGSIVHKILQAFDSNNCIVYDPYRQSRGEERTRDIVFVNTKEELLTNADIISFHIPLLPSTKHFISHKEIPLLKENVKIINTSRGGIVDEDTLIDFLTTHPQAGAYIDTREEEPDLPKKGLQKLSNCIITPHLGSMTEKANQAMHYFKELDSKDLM